MYRTTVEGNNKNGSNSHPLYILLGKPPGLIRGSLFWLLKLDNLTEGRTLKKIVEYLTGCHIIVLTFNA